MSGKKNLIKVKRPWMFIRYSRVLTSIIKSYFWQIFDVKKRFYFGYIPVLLLIICRSRTRKNYRTPDIGITLFVKNGLKFVIQKRGNRKEILKIHGMHVTHKIIGRFFVFFSYQILHVHMLLLFLRLCKLLPD